MNTRRWTIIPTLIVSLFLHGCIQTLAVRTMGGILEEGMDAFYEEGDLDLAREGLGGNLKLLEALIKADPENEALLNFAAQGFSAYALAFAEDDSVERARALYHRSRGYALEAFRLRTGMDLMSVQLDEVEMKLPSLVGDDIAYVFWAAFTWGSYINVSRDDLSAMADLSKVNVMMEHVVATNRAFYYNGADLYLGAIKASVPAMLGGRPDEARAHFETAIRQTGGRFLMAHVIFAQTYCASTLDEVLFDELLGHVESFSLDSAPKLRLPNAVAKKKARRLMGMKAEIF